MKFKKKPVEIQAFQMTEEAATPDNYDDWPQWLKDAWMTPPKKAGALYCPDETARLAINTLEGTHNVSWDDYIIQGVQGELYPCKPDIFHATYTMPHDDPAVNKIYDHIDTFAQAMKDKMTDTYHDGRDGWDNKENTGNIEKGLQSASSRLFDGDDEQAVDVANFAMMLYFFDPDNRVS